jgi:predicted O-methyltransferase YrrM
MNKTSKLLNALFLIIRQPSLLNKILDDTEVNKEEVIKKYNFPKGLKTIELTELLPDIEITVEPYCAMDGGSTPIDLALLKGMAAKYTNCNYFEIGTWRGESVANVATVAKKCVTLNLPDKDMLLMGMDKSYVELHRFFSKKLDNVVHLQANSQTFDFASMNQKFDLIFIDGDHHYESVKNDTKNAFKLLKDENSVIVWHDYGNTPADIRWDVFRGILDGTREENIKYLYRVSNTLCAIYTKQNIASDYTEPNANPKKQFSLKIKADKLKA